jgi:hypothetical protein
MFIEVKGISMEFIETPNGEKKIILDENGKTCLRYYDEKSKFWVSIYENPNNTHGGEDLVEALRNILLEKYNLL